jgi:hypothetical protein
MKKKTVVWVHVVGISLLFWFLGVDSFWFNERCGNCHYERDAVQYRVFGAVIYERSQDHHAIMELVARDLGAVCLHQDIDLNRIKMYRFRGLCIHDGPIIHRTWRLSGGESWYTEELAAKVRILARDNPELGEEFRNRVVYGHDWNYWGRFIRELRDDKIEQVVLTAGSLSDIELREIADRIEQIEWLVLAYGHEDFPRQSDENAEIILALGGKAVSYLIEKITDERPSRWLAWASVGDVAHIVLSMIYGRDWPTREFEESHELAWKDSYVDYHRRFLRSESAEENRKNREKLRDAWREMIESLREEKK